VLIVSAAPINAKEVQKEDWQKVAECAAAYRANSQIADANRAPSMRAMIADQASDYEKAAVQRYSAEKKTEQNATQKAVIAYIDKAVLNFSHQPRSAVEKFIDGCPQV
jgi:hypothetical protein